MTQDAAPGDRDRPVRASRPSEPGAPAGDAYVTPYTLLFPDGDGFVAADLDDPSALPRVGDIVEYIDERGTLSRFRVKEVIHTVQSSPAQRPAVADEAASPNALARPGGDEAEVPGSTGLVRAGLPQVVLGSID